MQVNQGESLGFGAVAPTHENQKRYKTFKALGILLWYPRAEWLGGIDELCDVIAEEQTVSAEDMNSIRSFAAHMGAQEILDVQEAYVDMFDRVRSLSLHLFEHVHGESRDRGQAMVDLTERYKEQGFSLAESELPDYLPVFLEYLSLLPKEQALEELAEIGHILAALGKRLAERRSPYSTVFDSLIRLAGREPEKVTARIEPQMISLEQLDKEWEEKPIDFMGAEAPKTGSDGGCGGGGCSCSGKIAQGAGA